MEAQAGGPPESSGAAEGPPNCPPKGEGGPAKAIADVADVAGGAG